MGKETADAFKIIIQLGAILAIVAAYPRRFTGLLRFDDNSGLPGFAASGLLVITSFPASLVGLLAHKTIEEKLFSTLTVAVALAVGAVWILAVEYFRPKVKSRRRRFADVEGGAGHRAVSVSRRSGRACPGRRRPSSAA